MSVNLLGEAQVTSSDVLDALAKRHAHVSQGAREWIFVRELRIGTGFGGYGPGGEGADQRIDAFALHTWPSKQFLRVAYEVKVSRGDFLREMKNPRKRRAALLRSNEFYFAAPRGLIRPDEVPPEAGLVEVWADEDGAINQRAVIAAPFRDGFPPTWRFVASLLRSVAT